MRTIGLFVAVDKVISTYPALDIPKIFVNVSVIVKKVMLGASSAVGIVPICLVSLA